MSIWGREFMPPDEIASEWCLGWVSREDVPDGREALQIASDELHRDADSLQAKAVLMREESEVEAKINGHEFPYLVECTKRARSFEFFWRIEPAPQPTPQTCPTCGSDDPTIDGSYDRGRAAIPRSVKVPSRLCPDPFHQPTQDPG